MQKQQAASEPKVNADAGYPDRERKRKTCAGLMTSDGDETEGDEEPPFLKDDDLSDAIVARDDDDDDDARSSSVPQDLR